MARTRSEMRDVLLSISCNRFAISPMRRSGPARRGQCRDRRLRTRFQQFRLYVLAREIGRQLPQVILSMTAQQRVDAVFQIADGQRVGRTFVLLYERGFQLFDF